VTEVTEAAAGAGRRPSQPLALPDRGLPAAIDPSPLPRSLSYTALATYERCAYRYYVQRVLGLPELPNPARPQDRGRPAAAGAEPVPGGAERGTLIHRLLAGLDLRAPSLREPMPEDVRDLLGALVGSPTFARLPGLRDVRREQRFAFPLGGTLITGVFDLIAEAGPGRMLVLDYKSDRLDGAAPAAIVGERYLAQRLIYALAALRLGVGGVEVVHLFLEAPDDPVAARFSASELPALEAALAERVARVGGSGADDFPVTDAPGQPVCDRCPAQDGLCSYPPALTMRPGASR
ncbi:MAG: PD-(D/E)XK nuclease family protein, partial [Acidobacteriota bacterium]|nr:PD-(D/E)XK nuclease family protein [Acidobacteriota bacterium]